MYHFQGILKVTDEGEWRKSLRIDLDLFLKTDRMKASLKKWCWGWQERFYFRLLSPIKKENAIEKAYDVLMFLTIIVSLIPLTTKSHTGIFMWLDFVSTIIFIIDYILRLLTADYKLGKGKLSFFLYPFIFLALADLLCILPSFFCWIIVCGSLSLFAILKISKYWPMS